MTEFLEVEEGRIGYEVAGEGPLVVLVHGMGDRRSVFHPLRDHLVRAGFRVATMDLRGHGDSSLPWPSYTRADTARDILALIRRLGGPAVIVGHSFAGGSATIAAAQEPDLVSAVVEICPFTRVQQTDLRGLLRNRHHRRGMIRLMTFAALRRAGLWKRYLDVAYPGVKPAGYAEHVAAVEADLRRPGRVAVPAKMGMTSLSDADARLADLRRPALVVMGTLDPDWADPRAEAECVVAAMPPGIGSVAMIEGAGHYPHRQFPDEVAAVVVPFVQEHAVEGNVRG